MGATFRFRRILRLQRQLRKAMAHELVLLETERAEVERAAAAARAAAGASRIAAGNAARAGGRAADLRLHADYQRAQVASARLLHARATELAETIERKRADLVTRRTKEQQFEVLEAREDGRRAGEEARAEAMLHDDLARRRSPWGDVG